LFTFNFQKFNRLVCKQCKIKFNKLFDLVEHHRYTHNQMIKTTFDLFSITQSNKEAPPTGITPINISPVGYLNCDPISYLLNLYWDKEIRKKCSTCENVYSRPIYRQHVVSCKSNVAVNEEADVKKYLTAEEKPYPTVVADAQGLDETSEKDQIEFIHSILSEILSKIDAAAKEAPHDFEIPEDVKEGNGQQNKNYICVILLMEKREIFDFWEEGLKKEKKHNF
jgi:hypothetical protein